ncbi:MAG: inorganic phosphate transporter [Tissierellia bacterium]|nr:inorganic phosphate transporter [Tissierellia bacterium]
MEISFSEFLLQLFNNNILLFITILTLASILVNGWTDAPNAIATCISTRSIRVSWAILMAAVFNFLGVFLMTIINANVAQTIYNMVDFGENYRDALVALCASLLSIVIWATAAWSLGIPTSESHALIAGISGAAVALHNGLSGININEWIKVLYGLGLSTALGFTMGWLAVKTTELIFRNSNRLKANIFFKKAQITAAASMAFMHGAQDGQKFMAVFMLGIFLANGQTVSNFYIPVWMMLLCSLVMALGTSIGGYRIIKSVGMNMVKLEKYQGFSADMAAALCLLIFSITGIPASTTHTKTTSIMGVGAAKSLFSVNWTFIKEMLVAWILTFPGCGIIGFLMAKLFTTIF